MALLIALGVHSAGRCKVRVRLSVARSSSTSHYDRARTSKAHLLQCKYPRYSHAQCHVLPWKTHTRTRAGALPPTSRRLLQRSDCSRPLGFGRISAPLNLNVQATHQRSLLVPKASAGTKWPFFSAIIMRSMFRASHDIGSISGVLNDDVCTHPQWIMIDTLETACGFL